MLNDRPTGNVFIRNFDQGVIEELGAVIRTDYLPTPVRQRRGYWIDEIFTDPMAVPVIFNNPEAIYEKKIYPSYLITRTTPYEPSLVRWHSVKQAEYRAGVSGSEEVVSGTPGVSGFDAVSGFGLLELKPQAWPVDIYYSVACYARYEHEAIPMLKRILKTFPPYSKISLIDSLGENRDYTVFAETAPQDIGEFVDVADRLRGYSLDIRVEGELDVQDPVRVPTVRTVANRIDRL